MIFTVVWLPSAESDLADIWTEAGNRAAITRAADYLDRQLRSDPETKGHVFRDRWVAAYPPLVPTYKVIPEDRLVKVVQVWRDDLLSFN